MKNTKRISILSALALGLVIAAGAFVMPAVSYANDPDHDKPAGEHKDGEHGDDHDHDHGDKKGH